MVKSPNGAMAKFHAINAKSNNMPGESFYDYTYLEQKNIGKNLTGHLRVLYFNLLKKLEFWPKLKISKRHLSTFI